MIASLATVFSGKTSLRSLGFSSFTTPVCFRPSSTHGAAGGALGEGGQLKGSRLQVTLERLIYCGTGVGMRDEQKRYMGGGRTPCTDIIFVTQTDILSNTLLRLGSSYGRCEKLYCKFLTLQWRGKGTKSLAAAVTSKGKLTTGIKGVTNPSPHPKVYELQLKDSYFSWECLFLQMLWCCYFTDAAVTLRIFS